MRKKALCLGLFLSIVLSSFTMAGCGKSDENEEVEVGIVLPTKDESRWLQDQSRFESKLEEAGISNEVLFSQGDLSTENTNVETLISKKAKVLIICAHDGTACGAAVEKAKQAGMTVIAYDRLITGTDAVDYYVTFDSMAVGKAQGKYLVSIIPKGCKNIPLYIYTGASTDSNSFYFLEGAWEAIQPYLKIGKIVVANSAYANAYKNKPKLTKAEQMKIVEVNNTKWDPAIAKALAEQQLKKTAAKYKRNVLVLAPNDDTARSIGEAFRNDKGIVTYKITGQDAVKESVQAILDGTQSMTIFKDTRTLASDAIDMAISIINGQTPSTDTTYPNGVKDVPSKQTLIKVITKNNVKTELIESGYYSSNDFKME